MIAYIPGFNLGKSIVASFSAGEETDTILQQRGCNILHYSNGIIELVQEQYTIHVDREHSEFFECLHDFDVIEIYSSGIIRLQCSLYAGDNTLFITSKCNSNCVMCPSSDNSRRKGVIPEGAEIMDLLRHYPEGIRHITITGGEPFLFREEMFEALSYLKNNHGDTEYLILTNGRIFCLDRYIDQLVTTMPRGTTLAIPVHGSTDAKHDAITRAPGSFEQTLSGISKLLAKKIPIEIRIVVSKLNAEDLNAIADLIITKLPTVYRVHFIGLEMLGNAIVNSDRVWLTYMEAFKASKLAIDNLITAGINVALYNFPLCQVDPAYWPICMQSISDYKQNYSDKCNYCTKRSVCGGVFVSSMKFAENDLCPVEA